MNAGKEFGLSAMALSSAGGIHHLQTEQQKARDPDCSNHLSHPDAEYSGIKGLAALCHGCVNTAKPLDLELIFGTEIGMNPDKITRCACQR